MRSNLERCCKEADGNPASMVRGQLIDPRKKEKDEEITRAKVIFWDRIRPALTSETHSIDSKSATDRAVPPPRAFRFFTGVVCPPQCLLLRKLHLDLR